MHSLEMEVRQLRSTGAIDEAAAAHAIALERRTLFSVFDELRAALYAAVVLIVTGVGILVKEHLDRIGPLTLIFALAIAGAACYVPAIRAKSRGNGQSTVTDYVLLLGALIVSADVGYAESQFHWVVAMPVAGYLWSAAPNAATDYLHLGTSAWLVPMCPLVFAAVALATGLQRRAHAPIVAFMCMACTAYELRRLTGLSLETRLIVWGCLLLLVSIILERYLREGHSGITSRKVRDEDAAAGILGIAGSAVLTPHSPPKAAPSFEGAGGRFGGGGATGQY